MCQNFGKVGQSHEPYLPDDFLSAPEMMNELVDSLSANERQRMENGKVDILNVLLERGKCFWCNFLCMTNQQLKVKALL